MIDLTPLDVRKKKGDFRRGLRGYEPAVVDEFLDLVAERLEELVRENVQLREKLGGLTETISSYRDREKAMNEALVSAQQLREEVRVQASRDSELAIREARLEAERIVAEARQQATAAAESVRRLKGRRSRFLRSYRTLLERQLAELDEQDSSESADDVADQP
jgi:cell division initiation protein